MLQFYLNSILTKLISKNKSITNKDFIELRAVVTEKLLEEVDLFIQDHLPSELRDQYKKEMDSLLLLDNVEMILTKMGYYLTLIPDFKFKLFARLDNVLSEIKFSLLV